MWRSIIHVGRRPAFRQDRWVVAYSVSVNAPSNSPKTSRVGKQQDSPALGYY